MLWVLQGFLDYRDDLVLKRLTTSKIKIITHNIIPIKFREWNIFLITVHIVRIMVIEDSLYCIETKEVSLFTCVAITLVGSSSWSSRTLDNNDKNSVQKNWKIAHIWTFLHFNRHFSTVLQYVVPESWFLVTTYIPIPSLMSNDNVIIVWSMLLSAYIVQSHTCLTFVFLDHKLWGVSYLHRWRLKF